jgi:ATP-binding cassette, subfamily B, bacterial
MRGGDGTERSRPTRSARYRGVLSLVLLALAVAAGLELAEPWPAKTIVDSFVGSHPPAWMPGVVIDLSDHGGLAFFAAALLAIVSRKIDRRIFWLAVLALGVAVLAVGLLTRGPAGLALVPAASAAGVAALAALMLTLHIRWKRRDARGAPATLFRTFARFARPYRVRLSIGLLALAVGVVVELAEPWPVKVVVDSYLGTHPLPAWMPGAVHGLSDYGGIALFCAALLVVVAFAGVLTYVGTYWTQSVGQRITFDIREAVHAHLHRLSLAYHHSQRPGDLANRLTGDVERIQVAAITVVGTFVTSVLTLAGMLAVMLYVDWKFTLLAVTIAPLLLATVYRYTKRIKSSARRARTYEGRVASVVQESLSAIHLVQAYTREEYEFERFRREASESLDSNIEAAMLQARFAPVVDVLTAIATVAVLFVGALQVKSGNLTIGLLLVFLAYLKGFYRPIKQLSKLSFTIAKGSAAAERLTEVMAAAPALPESAAPYTPRIVRGVVGFDGVSFAYPLGEDAALQDVSLTAEPGKTVALVGPTGAGKSTLVSLIPRFYDADSGSVTVDGVDVRDWDLRTLRSNISVLLQETWLFQSSLFDNILYGRPGATPEDAIEAAVAANAHEFIERLPDGYETLVGPRGVTLSGGQRQRIAIARAMLRAAPIVLLDEPTTWLDAENEQLVLDAIRRLVVGRTTILIAHTEAPVIAADHVLVMDGGRIVDRGTYEDLRRAGFPYRRLRTVGASGPAPSS